ncbi:MAG: glutamate formimidoyltransferase [Anaerolineae bacterium]|nr:glutamate formimidoyltransferase [Anaerolineae bacterium]
MTWIECVPNFSEGRRPEVISAIRAAIASTPVQVLDVSSDPDHNRTVITFIGTPDAVAEAAFRGIQTAAALIDLDDHDGVHPRIGATDVVPFIPLRDATIDQCVEIAHRLGDRVAQTLAIPVYFYESAALRPERQNLAVVRSDPYERLRESIVTNPLKLPDRGAPILGKAGAVAIGARQPLIAFNVYLNTPDVNIAKDIAQVIRASGGGLPYVKALGVLVQGQAQVTINVIDYRITGLHPIFEAVRSAAIDRGVSITHTEIVGLVPQSALLAAALAYLQLPPSAKDLILEARVGSMTGDYREIRFE